MNQLTKFLVDGILNEGEQKTLAAYGGGFKPPTAGHFEVVKKALKDNPEIDEFIIYVGSGERNGITQAESILIWEVYQTYLPMKVKIEPSKAPIGDVLRLGKNNPQDKVYFVIGAREDNEGDLEDIKNRTRAIGGKHPNMEVKVITTKNEGMSGTNARKAAKVSFEDFAKFLPTELSNDEKETVYNIVKPVVKESLNENATPPQTIIGSKTKLVLVSTNNEVLGLTSRYDVFDKEDSLIGYVEITDRSKGSKLAKDAIQVGNVELNSPNQGYGSSLYLSLINTFSLPIISDPSLSTQGHYLWGSLVKKGYAKTWEDERKRNRYISISEYKSLNENASYSQDIDVKSKIMQLTQHMLDKGYNIEPLPNVELLDGDSVNAREFLGKTAYYDPNSATIVLYTEGRHPKDIVRSFSHEMIHHIQNLEGRLGNITTTNTQEDDHLNDIEAEANLKGTMTFRNWTDSLNENLNDGLYPFKVIDKTYDEGDNSLITVEYEFITPNNSYRVEFYSGEYSPESKTFDLSFGVNTGEFNTIDTFQMTGEGNARKILKTIRNIIEDFIDKEDVEKIIVDGTDEKRKRIYKAIFSKLSNKIEIKEANLKDTTPPRNWTNSLNENILPQEKFAQETNQDYIEQSLKILPNKDKYNLKDYTVEILPIGKVKPTQFGEDYINASSEYEAEQYQKYIDGEIEAEDLRREDFYPIVVDKDTMEILDGNHRHAVHTMLSIPKIKAILVSKKLNEIQTPANEKDVDPKELKMGIEVEMEHTDSPAEAKVIALQHLAEDPKYYTKLASLNLEGKKNKDPFGLNQYARELAQGLEEDLDKENIKCSNCGWGWDLSNGGDDPYLCHKCGHDNKPNLMEGRYDTITNKLSKIIFEAFKDMHDRGEDKGEISLTIGPNDEDIISNEFEFDLEATVEFGDDDQYGVDGGANVGFDDSGDEVTPLISVRFKIPKNPKWNIISFDIKDVVRHELEHLTQEGENLKSGKFIKDDQILRNLIDMKLLSKAEYFKLEKEVDAMLQGMYFKAKKSKTPFKKVLNDYLDIFVDQKSISKEEKDDVLNIWRSRRKALSLPPFE